ncbi:MAG: metallophosphoesterase [Promethearchaeota archaeon]
MSQKGNDIEKKTSKGSGRKRWMPKPPERKKNPLTIKILSWIVATFMILFPVALYLIFQDDIDKGLNSGDRSYYLGGIFLIVSVFGLLAMTFIYLALRKTRPKWPKKSNVVVFRAFSVIGAACGVAMPILLYWMFSRDINSALRNWDETAISYVAGIIIIFTMLGILTTYFIYGAIRKTKKRNAVIFTAIFVPILITGSIIGAIYNIASQVPELRGPYLSWTNDPTTTMTISFETKIARNYQLYYGESVWSLTNTSAFNRTGPREYDGYYHYNITLMDLMPGNRYYYKIPGILDDPANFRTAPTDPSVKFKFILYGDSREDHPIFDNQHIPLVKQILAQVDLSEISFVINTGDTARVHDDPYLWNLHFMALRDLAKSVPYFVASGNHEWNDGYVWNSTEMEPAIDIQDFPAKTDRAEKIGSYHETSFAFGFGNGYFIFIGYPDAGSNRTDYINWLESELQFARDNFEFIFVSLHRPPFDDREGDSSDDNADIIKSECPLFHKYSVDAVFAGHNHVLAHQNITWENDRSGKNITYIISGGGGASLRSPQYGSWNNTYGCGFHGKTVFCKRAYNYYIVEIDGSTGVARFTAWELGNTASPLENFTIQV